MDGSRWNTLESKTVKIRFKSDGRVIIYYIIVTSWQVLSVIDSSLIIIMFILIIMITKM